MQTSSADRRNTRTYLREFLPASIGYCVVLAVVLAIIPDDAPAAVRVVGLLLPLVPAALGVRAIVRHVRRLDEYQRSLALEASASAFGVSMFAALFVGFLGVAGVATPWSGWIVYTAGMLTLALVTIKQRTQ